MEHYNIGDTEHTSEPPEIPGQLPTSDSNNGNNGNSNDNKDGPSGCIVMRVKPNSKVGHLVDYAIGRLKSNGGIEQILWTGEGEALEKAVSCAEVTKRRAAGEFKDRRLYQASCLFYQRVRQFYEPKLPGLDRLQVTREVPAVRCLLSLRPLPPEANPLPADAEFARHFAHSVVPAEAKRQRAAPASNPNQRHVTKVKAKKRTATAGATAGSGGGGGGARKNSAAAAGSGRAATSGSV